MSHGGQGHGRNAAAAFAVWISTKLARSNAGFEVGRDDAGGSRKDAFRRAMGRGCNFTDEILRHLQARVFQSQLTKFRDDLSALGRIEDFRIRCSALRGEDAEPHLS